MILHRYRIATAAAIVCFGVSAASAAAQEPGYSLALSGPTSATVSQPVVFTASGAKPASEFFSSWLDVFAIPVSVLSTCPADYFNALQIASETYAQGGDTVVRALEIGRAETSFSNPLVHTPRVAGQFLVCGYLNDGLHYEYATASLALNVAGAGGGSPPPGGGTAPRIEVSVTQSFKVRARGTRFDVLRLESVDAGASVIAKCRRNGRKCPGRARKTLRLGAGSGTVDLTPFTGLTLRPGTVLTIKVTAPDAVGAARIIKVRRDKAPRTISRCVTAGGTVVRC